jgi:hypothetical protein
LRCDRHWFLALFFMTFGRERSCLDFAPDRKNGFGARIRKPEADATRCWAENMSHGAHKEVKRFLFCQVMAYAVI